MFYHALALGYAETTVALKALSVLFLEQRLITISLDK
jgi:hypothetical protein